ncbi:NADH-ubiquinone/plastoquinone oxidoreductase, chain 6 [Pyrobaculum islandicum DSM 4184]|uniref:NADH-ubiquinone/plastoquinone oxidoreductase, chain 6 n=1 Tax=Pyrobaculum islandicum (strain DSM 4184 / JCM 9189 / GEO3) TaxID=384616 RepID=A1RV01_PYRIL|nr:hypothetical protein [Pyrobaculum islandicum]ABL88783.1 NADH-ubiquinone/plastoquinone oxidoreductase, chain 6 [Pyrobaculum islandicum DSM 4184]
MLDLLILFTTLFFGLLTVFSRDNVYAAISLSITAGTVGAYYAYLAQFASAFLIFVIYIGAVMLLVIITAAMYGGVQRWGVKYLLVVSIVFLVTSVLGIWLWFTPHTTLATPIQLGDLHSIIILLLGVAAVSLVVSVEVAKKL